MSVVVAIVLALCVPFAQLPTSDNRVECCCPDPDKCKCPDHRPDDSPQPTMQACHKKAPNGVTNQLASFLAPPPPTTVAPARIALLVPHQAPAPHPAPPPHRPDAPS